MKRLNGQPLILLLGFVGAVFAVLNLTLDDGALSPRARWILSLVSPAPRVFSEGRGGPRYKVNRCQAKLILDDGSALLWGLDRASYSKIPGPHRHALFHMKPWLSVKNEGLERHWGYFQKFLCEPANAALGLPPGRSVREFRVDCGSTDGSALHGSCP